MHTMRKFQIIKTAMKNIKQDNGADGVLPMRGQFKRGSETASLKMWRSLGDLYDKSEPCRVLEEEHPRQRKKRANMVK